MTKNRVRHGRTVQNPTQKLPGKAILPAVFGVLLGLVATGGALLLSAWLIKHFSIDDGAFPIISMLVKLIGIGVTVIFTARRVAQKNAVVGAVMGLVYIAACFLLFLALGGSFVSVKTLLLDLLTGLAGGILFGALFSGKKKA